MRAVQIIRFGGPEIRDVVDLPDPVPGDGEQLFDISSAGVDTTGCLETSGRPWPVHPPTPGDRDHRGGWTELSSS